MQNSIYAAYRADRFGKKLTIRDGGPDPVAEIPFPQDARVTFRMLSAAVTEQGFTVSGTWRPVRSMLRAELVRA